MVWTRRTLTLAGVALLAHGAFAADADSACGADGELCGPSAYFFGWMGCAVALVFANLGSAYGTAKAGVGIMSMGVMNPEMVIKNIIPVVMAGILGIYGLIVAVLVQSKISGAGDDLKYAQ